MKTSTRKLSTCALALAACAYMPGAGAGLADLANVPLGTSTTNVKPNIMFILDDSGSMASEYMPDDMSGTDRYGYKSAQCNGLWFNPNVTYAPPVAVAADGTVSSYPNATFTAAWVDGYNTGAGTTNLDGWGYYNYTGSQPALSWSYNTDGTLATSTFITECRTRNWNSGPFTWVAVTSASSATIKQNYANWYSYYRSRLLTMRTAGGRAFQSLDSNYRVGFTMISDKTVTSSNFLDIADFGNTQKYNFFNKLYTSYSGSWTPLRGALAKTGQYYGNVAASQRSDPVQYSCQRNYAILSTDGYWNDNIETSTYGPYKLDRTTPVGQQDADEVRPMKDGGSTVVTTTTTDPLETITTSTADITTTQGGTYYRVDSSTDGGSCYSWQYRVRRNEASCSVTWTQTSTQTRTENSISTLVTTNGVAGTPTSSTSVSTSTTHSPSSAPACPDANWTTGTARSDRCWTSSELSSRGLSAGISRYIASGGSTDSAGPSTVTGTTTNDPPATTTTSTTTSGGSTNSLADVAEYYYRTDLRTDLDDTLKPAGADTAAHQHMTTYTVGLGVKGTLSYDQNYLNTPATGDYAALIAGTKNWPTPTGNATNIDDLWHAAVNGRGRYFSASDPNSLAASLSTTLGEITAARGSAAAAAGSSLKPTESDGWIFLPSYVTQSGSSSWYGDVRAFKRRISNGKALAPDTTEGAELWSARNKLEARTTARRILFKSGTSLAEFNYANLAAAGLNASFDNRCTTASPVLSQCSSINPTAQAKVTGTNLVDFIAGDKSLYLNAASADNQVFRTRSYRLGDIVNSSPAYVAKPPFRYADSGYASFISSKANRAAMVYIGSNDGMLHAFKVGLSVDGSNNAVVASDAGTELWAFVPTAVIPNLWRLADRDYDDDHRYFVDATPVVGDVYDSTAGRWRTILVSGLGKGGMAYFALDITDPANPELLWEFTDANLGYSYGNPVITKNQAGTWVVMFGSGINNNAGNGKGRLFIRNAVTGAAENGGHIETSAGSTTTPSNLVRIDAWIDSVTDNTALRVYGGDMEGNLWRFDIDDRIAPSGNEATLLGIAQTGTGTRQPITAKPLLSEISSGGTRYAVISFGTGRYLGTNDLSDTTLQSIYSVKDSLASTGLGVLRDTGALLVKQTLGSNRKVTTPASVDWAAKNGWYVDLDQSARERVFVDGVSVDTSVIAFASSVPGSDICVPGGNSYLYEFNLLSGVVNTVLGASTMIVGLSSEEHPDGSRGTVATGLDGNITVTPRTTGASIGPGNVRRSSWRELIN